MKAFFIEPHPSRKNYYIINNNFNTIPMPMIHTSFQYLMARLVGMNYEDYLIFCKEQLGALVVRSKGARYASVYFPNTSNVKRFVEILNDNFERSYDGVYEK